MFLLGWILQTWLTRTFRLPDFVLCKQSYRGEGIPPPVHSEAQKFPPNSFRGMRRNREGRKSNRLSSGVSANPLHEKREVRSGFHRVATGKCATMTSLKTSGSGLSPCCQQKVLLVEGDRRCCKRDLHEELCQGNMIRGKPYIPDSCV